ncbi:MAG: hypothetical protein ABW068_07230 [Candidatus Thiodiazotropha sp.]
MKNNTHITAQFKGKLFALTVAAVGTAVVGLSVISVYLGISSIGELKSGVIDTLQVKQQQMQSSLENSLEVVGNSIQAMG